MWTVFHALVALSETLVKAEITVLWSSASAPSGNFWSAKCKVNFLCPLQTSCKSISRHIGHRSIIMYLMCSLSFSLVLQFHAPTLTITFLSLRWIMCSPLFPSRPLDYFVFTSYLPEWCSLSHPPRSNILSLSLSLKHCTFWLSRSSVNIIESESRVELIVKTIALRSDCPAEELSKLCLNYSKRCVGGIGGARVLLGYSAEDAGRY